MSVIPFVQPFGWDQVTVYNSEIKVPTILQKMPNGGRGVPQPRVSKADVKSCQGALSDRTRSPLPAACVVTSQGILVNNKSRCARRAEH